MAGVVDDPLPFQAIGWISMIGASAIFVIGGFAGIDARYAAMPAPVLHFARLHDNSLVPTYGLAWRF